MAVHKFCHMTYVVYWLLWKQPQLLCDTRVHNRVCTLKQSVLWISSLSRKKRQNEKQVSYETSVTDTECTSSVTTRNVRSSCRNCGVRTVVALCCVGTYQKNQYRTPSRAIFSLVDVTHWMYQARTHTHTEISLCLTELLLLRAHFLSVFIWTIFNAVFCKCEKIFSIKFLFGNKQV